MKVAFRLSRLNGLKVPAVDLDMGDLAVVSGGIYDGRVILKTYRGATQLSDHDGKRGTTWDDVACEALMSVLLETGDSILLTVEE